MIVSPCDEARNPSLQAVVATQARQKVMANAMVAASSKMTCDGAKKYAIVFPDQADRVKNLSRG
jgi:hypothetical protein